MYITSVRIVTAAVCAAAAAGCSSEMSTAAGNVQSRTVAVTAEVAQQLYSRSYKESGQVEEGQFFMTYNNTDNSYNVATVDFGRDGVSPVIGMVTVPSADASKPAEALKWINVGGGSTPTFCLDNVKPEFADAAQSSATKIIFDVDKNPFVAGVFDTENGTNDLLWGSSQVSRNAKTVNFDLHHYMSRVRVQVTVDREYEANGELDLEGATVSISSLVLKPESYDRLDGSLSLGETPEYNTLKIVNEEYDWAQKEGNDVYISADFVLPPQDILEDENRPKLRIELKNGAVYSGILPHAMLIDNGSTPELSYPVALSFLKEHILTIRTVVTGTPPELAFMPVWVVQWVDKGNFSIDAHQAGIYTKQEFDRLTAYYAENNVYQLPRYGRIVTVTDQQKNEEIWVFDFFHSVVLDYDTIRGSMADRSKGQKDFQFNFNGYTILLNKDNETVTLTPERLYDIVTRKE